MTPSALRYDAYGRSLFLRPLARARRWTLWAAVPFVLAIPVVTSAAEHRLSGPHLPRLADLATLLGIADAPMTKPAVPFMRDWCSLILLASIPLSIVCLRYLWDALAEAASELEASGAWRCRIIQLPLSRLGRWAIHGMSLDASVSVRERFRTLLASLGQPSGRRALLTVTVAIIASVALSLYEAHSQLFLVLAPHHLSDADAGHWASNAYTNWWASWHHVAGALVYCGFAVAGVTTILAQNDAAIAAIRLLTVAESFVSFEVDWLNGDGVYGWRAAQRVMRIVCVSIALRAVQLTALVVLLNILNPISLGVIATVWLVFLITYIWYPYHLFSARCERLKHRRIDELTREFRLQGLSLMKPSDRARAFVDEIARVRRATINPFRLTSWESSSFIVVVTLPVCLTIVQIVTA